MTIFPPLPDRDDTQRMLQPILPTLYRGIDAGLEAAKLYFEGVDHEFEPGLHAGIVRAHTKHFLGRAGFALEDLPNNGICLQYRDFRLKILKAKEESLPFVGTSRARLAFMQQIIRFREAELRPPRWNLLMLWNIDHQLRLVELRVACTMPTESDDEGVEEYWAFPVEHPALSIRVDAPLQTDGDDDLDDLGYSVPGSSAASRTETAE